MTNVPELWIFSCNSFYLKMFFLVKCNFFLLCSWTISCWGWFPETFHFNLLFVVHMREWLTAGAGDQAQLIWTFQQLLMRLWDIWLMKMEVFMPKVLGAHGRAAERPLELWLTSTKCHVTKIETENNLSLFPQTAWSEASTALPLSE